MHYLKLVRRIPRRLVLLAIALAALFVVLQQTINFSFDEIRDTVDSAGIFGPLVYALVLFLGLSVPFNPVSDLATVNVAALLFEPRVSVGATFLAHTAALSVNFLVARRFGDRILRLLSGDAATAFIERFGKRMTYSSVFTLRFALPLTGIGIDVVTYLAAIGRLSFIRFYIVSIIPWTLVSLIYFYSTSYLRDRSIVLFFLPAILLLVLPTAFLFWRRRCNAARAAAQQTVDA